MSRDGWAALPSGATGLSAVCDCGISWSYSLTIFQLVNNVVHFFFSCVEHSAAKKAKIEEEDVNNNVDMSQLAEKYNICPKTGKLVEVSQLAEKYNICPKTGKLFPKSQVRMLSAQHRRMKLRKQPSLFVQTVRRNMILQAIDTRSYCCMKQCFKKEPRLWTLHCWWNSKENKQKQ